MTGSTDGGLALALLSTTAYNSGLIVEKQALGRLPAISGRRVVSLALTLGSSPRWLTGFALMLSGLAFQVLALMLAPVTLVQPVIASGVAVVLVLSRLVLREHLGRGQYACVAVMALSVILLALSAGRGASDVGHSFGTLQARCRRARGDTGGRSPACPTASPPACCTAWRRWPSRRCPVRSCTVTGPRNS